MFDINGIPEPTQKNEVEVPKPFHQLGEIALIEALEERSPEVASSFELASPFVKLPISFRSAAPLSAFLAAGEIEKGADAAESVSIVQSTLERGAEIFAGLPPMAWFTLGGIAVLTILMFLVRRDRVDIYSKNAREVMSHGLRGLNHFGNENVTKWFAGNEMVNILEESGKLINAKDPLNLLIRSTAGILSFDSLGTTPVGLGALTTFLGLYWEYKADKPHAKAMRRAEMMIMERGRPQLLYRMSDASDDHIEVAQRIARGKYRESDHGEEVLIQALHHFSAAQLSYRAAIHEIAARPGLKKLFHAEQHIGRAMSAATMFDAGIAISNAIDRDATGTIIEQMDRLKGEIIRRREDAEAGGWPRGGSAVDRYEEDAAALAAEQNGSTLQFGAVSAFAAAPLLCPIV